MFTILRKKDGRFTWSAVYRNDDIKKVIAVYEDITARDLMNDYKIVKTENMETIRED